MAVPTDSSVSPAASSSPGPAKHETPLQAGATITRDGFAWTATLGSAVTVTYGFRADPPGYSTPGENLAGTFSAFDTAQIDAVDEILGLWGDVANITLRRVGTGDSGVGAYSDNATILLGDYRSATDASGAFTYMPSPYGFAGGNEDGDVWDNGQYATNLNPTVGSYGWTTLVHELGHSLGLEHPGDYNAAPGVSITYANSAAFVEDSRQYTVMSYFDASNTGADHTSSTGLQYAATPLLDDITALQRLYGAKTTTRLGDTVYGFHSNADRAVYQLTSASDQRVMAIYDSGGFNTIDMSGYSTNQVIDLIAGSFSSTGALTDNLAIAVGTVVQGAIGGGGNDTFYVNSANDVIDGRGGTNAVVLPGMRADYSVSRVAGGVTTVTDGNVARGGTDQLSNIRYLEFSDQTVDLSAPVLTLGLVADTGVSASDQITSDPAVQGSADAGARVTFRAGGAVLGSTVADGSGHFSFVPPGLADGAVTLVASETDAAGDLVTSAPLTFTLDRVAPVVSVSASMGGGGVTTFARQGFSGTATGMLQGTVVTLLDGGAALGSTGVQAGGGFSTAGTLSGFGVHTIYARATDLAGNVGTSAALLLDVMPGVNPLFDAAYYLAQNPDVKAAGIDPYQHYLQYGWREGRDPNAWFDTRYYLAQNADVRAAGYDPLLHFETNGWSEGRDPSLVFSDAKYLAVNPDVAAVAGYDPLQHYMEWGRMEGRAAYLTGVAGVADPLVDAAFYDRQLGATLVPGGLAGQQQAAANYGSTGWQQGLNPDAWFDTAYYLSHNPDVAAAHVDPLLHYETYGFREGRDPSAQFSTSKYLAANRDVAAAGFDPLQHYVTNGMAEGRAIYAV